MNEKIKTIEVTRLNNASKYRSRGRIISANGIAPCLNAGGGGNIDPKIIILYDRVRENIPNAARRQDTDCGGGYLLMPFLPIV